MAVTTRREVPSAISVAIVDDHRLVVDGIAAHIAARRLGITVVISESTWSGLLSHPAFPTDVTVLDLNLDDSIAIGTKVRALSAAGTRTVVMSRHADSSSIQGAIRAGALAFVPKTESADELIAAIRSAADGKQFRNSHLTGALAEISTSDDPGLGKQEHLALTLYASGRSIREVASDMGTTEETVKSYIKRGRRKYREIGVDLGTKILLRRHGIREGWLTPE
ncbi:response regulator transcription factor [Lacisediminihabitans profunda]|uniref:Response regulator transcription factor n=1 Tax=Lacisediminihabitans profunda TaxID=2594790 RepID=A0A5C8UUJ5_9MICO|nr:response regulator transcription factor [Lacisediminihabitans profunda]TXN31633.1 response regulator transcription factor [Lacisediminihabitans profunda]